MIADTSHAALLLLDPEERRTTMDRVLAAIDEEPQTARMIANRLGIGEHEATRRCADLVTQGFAERGEKVANPDTGRRAYLLTPTSAGRRYLRTGEKPRSPVKRGDLVNAVIQAARNTPDAEGELTDALRVLDAHDAGQPQHRLPAPYGDPRRRVAIQDGMWLRRSGDYIHVRHMTPWHLRQASLWLRRHGAPDDDACIQALNRELDRRWRA